MLQIKSPMAYRLAVLAFFLGLMAQSYPAWAVEFKPSSNLGRPGNREGAATRGGCGPVSGPDLTALVPVSDMGLTTASYPTFYWYMPQTLCKLASFTLYAVEAQGKQETPVYQSTFWITGNSGLASFTLPADAMLPSLETGKDYRWELTLILNPEEPSGNKSVVGWISRVAPGPDLVAKLAKTKLEDRFSIYAEAGLWYDALKELADLRRDRPGDPGLLTQWMELLKSKAVQLDAIANQPSIHP